MDLDLSTEDERIRAAAELAAREVLAPEARAADEQRRFQRETVFELGARGLLDERLTAMQMALIAEELGRVDSSARGFVTVQSGLVARCLVEFAASEEVRRWLPRLRSGSAIACYALTEPEAGSDLRSIRSRAEPAADGGFRLSGEKHWITNGGVADRALYFAVAPEGLTAFWVPTDAPGFEHSRMPDAELGHRASDHAHLVLDRVGVPASAVVGEVGRGHRVALWALSQGRLGVAAGALGVLRASLDASVAFARERRQFGQRIGDFEMVQEAIAEMAAGAAAGRLLVREAAWLRDQGRDNAQAVAIAKLFCTEAALRAADQAILLHGARGYANGHPVERYWRDAKGMQIYEGTAHVQRIIIARALLGREDR
ncbi:MAG: acyl-CoA dehydrogenase family protein [Candidatus Dormibacteraceae bacterium]